jgi:hypothetical protein
MDRDLVACPACGDHDRDSLADARNNAKRKSRPAVISRQHGRPGLASRRERLMYATRERRGL